MNKERTVYIKPPRLPLDPDSEPVLISEEDHHKVDEISKVEDELIRTRAELGRLYQIIHGLTNTCNKIEIKMRDLRSELCEKYGLEPSRWVIDVPSKSMVKVHKDSPIPV